ncbi:hypothetical protein SELMODRAFT_404906 [Selaginella moellendorffii]|uniref:GTD-binding domain-containing protein n=1 Tax=Selaginella moellendorffii TaxID=88036 RepID=D8QXR7_SELML|nr:myosin-binding protein 2 [Selaginella moellendorffii]EFJ35468.1 hypothetical protein SELMODRAFT_404906 [Selaginella moellendorffii]|eukprot:XP_002963597.1 myosin-binding protein 2 [Selaginella moellendorffii]
MGSVCDCCVAAYCSCLAPSPAAAQLRKLELLLAQQQGGLLEVDFQKSWEVWNGGDCEVHGRCSFCNRLLSQSGKNERSVKRKFAKIYPEEVFSSVAWEEDAVISNEQFRRLMGALEAEREIVSALSVELEEERNAAAVAATETLAMITRLQEEKAAVQMEASQYKRMVEERTQYDQGAIGMLNEILAKQEEERMALSKEVEMYRSSLAGGKKRPCFSSVESGDGASMAATPQAGGQQRGKNLIESFERVESPPRVHSPSRGVGSSSMDVDEEGNGSSGIHDLREVSSTGTTSGGRSEHEFMEKYGPRWKSHDSPLKNSRSYGSASSSSGLYSSSVSRDDEDNAVDHIVRAFARPHGKLSEELRELSARLRALEAERDYHAFGGPRRGGGGNGEMEILEEISQQLRHIQALDRKSDDIKELSEASFVFSFKGFFSFNGLRQSLNSNINRLACMFLKPAELSYGDHHVGLSHLLESSPRKTPRAVPCLTRGIKVETPPLFSNSSYAVLHRQNLEWPMDARGRSETAFSGWDY